MKISTATRPGSTNQENEDFVVASGNTIVLLDGAGNPLGAEQGCHHGVAWFVRRLGATILNHATDHPATSLTASLGTAIESVANEHRSTCDLQHAGSPSATVVLLRQVEENWEYLVLADSTLMLTIGKRVEVVTDDRGAKIGERHRAEMDALPSGSSEHAEALRTYVEALRTYRNRLGGYWVASSDPEAANQAFIGQVKRTEVRSAALLSDGASRLADRFGLLSWQDVARILMRYGPGTLLDRVRDAEAGDPAGCRWPRGRVSDDATVAIVEPE